MVYGFFTNQVPDVHFLSELPFTKWLLKSAWTSIKFWWDFLFSFYSYLPLTSAHLLHLLWHLRVVISLTRQIYKGFLSFFLIRRSSRRTKCSQIQNSFYPWTTEPTREGISPGELCVSSPALRAGRVPQSTRVHHQGKQNSDISSLGKLHVLQTVSMHVYRGFNAASFVEL